MERYVVIVEISQFYRDFDIFLTFNSQLLYVTNIIIKYNIAKQITESEWDLVKNRRFVSQLRAPAKVRFVRCVVGSIDLENFHVGRMLSCQFSTIYVNFDKQKLTVVRNAFS